MCGACRDWHRRRREEEARAWSEQYGLTKDELDEAIALEERWQTVQAQRAARPDTGISPGFEEWSQQYEPTDLPWTTPRVPGTDMW